MILYKQNRKPLHYRKYLAAAWIWILIFNYGCSITREVPEGRYMLQKNSYSIRKGKIKEHSISNYFQQKPNKRIMGIRLYLRAYNLGAAFRDSSWLNRQLTENVGEPPVIYDSLMVQKTGENIKKHLNNLGYYNSEVYVLIKTNSFRRTKSVKYIIYPHKPYRIRKLHFNIPEKNVRTFVMADFSSSLVKEGALFAITTLKEEMNRITIDLNNEGFYYFIKSQITFDADTNLGTHQADITYNIMPLKARRQKLDTHSYIPDKQYKVDDIYLYFNLSKNEINRPDIDTELVEITGLKGMQYRYHLLFVSELTMNPRSIINGLFIKPTHFYKKSDVIESYKALTAYNTFRYINIEFSEKKTDDKQYGHLNCRIFLLRNKRYNFSTKSEVKNTGGDFGVEQNVSLGIRNTFKNAEYLNVSLHGAMEVQTVNNSTSSQSKWPFNVYEAGINTSLDFPRFMSFIKIKKPTRYLRPKTHMALGYNFQSRPDYTRYIINSSYGYTWAPVPYRYYGVNILDISSVKINPSFKFQQIIDNYTDPRIKYSYQDHLVMSTSFFFNYNTHQYKSSRPFYYFYAKADLGGVPWNALHYLVPNSVDTLGQNLIFGLPSSQYFLLAADGRYYLPGGKNIMHVFRANIGVGMPFGNSEALPFEKSFYIGGANSLRAWVIGTLGPGAYNSDATTFEMTGDIKIELNYELRFPLTNNFEAGLFVDAGNIWLLNSSTTIPEGQFHWTTFIPQMAVDFGYGLRYDLDFLIIRIDLAHPIYQPYLPKNSQWSALNTRGKLITQFNFAIGYPF